MFDRKVRDWEFQRFSMLIPDVMPCKNPEAKESPPPTRSIM